MVLYFWLGQPTIEGKIFAPSVASTFCERCTSSHEISLATINSTCFTGGEVLSTSFADIIKSITGYILGTNICAIMRGIFEMFFQSGKNDVFG